MIKAPYFPIVYLRGYAGSQGEIEDTVSSPYMGFNLGSTRIRQLHTGEAKPHVFESPVIRLMKDHQYIDAYHEGRVLPQGPVPSRSIWIYRYYDIADKEFGDGARREIEYHAQKLGDFLRHIRKSVMEDGESSRDFRVHLVAHSMGGLICRCYLQNPGIPGLDGEENSSNDWGKKGVDKVFTYGTPHGGIEFRSGLGWVEGLRDFLDPNNAGSFGARRMREFLNLHEGQPLNSLNNQFPEERVFCLVGTDSRDYGAAMGLSKRAVGALSDGLVQIKNASVLGAPRAFVHRSHSGYYGLVNSESGYQNLRRFLFGDLRVLVEMTDVQVTLPPIVDKKRQKGSKIRASYHMDTIFSIRGLQTELNRRTYDEGSAILVTYEQLTKNKPIKLFTAFLLAEARTNSRRKSLGFAIRLLVRVPDYEIDGSAFVDDHYEGGTIYVDKLNLEVTSGANGDIRGKYGWDSYTPNRATHPIPFSDNAMASDGTALFASIGFGRSNVKPSVSGNIKFTVTPWNKEPG